MRILLICGSFPPDACGIGDYVRGLAQAFGKLGHEVAVLTGGTATPEPNSESDCFQLMRSGGEWSYRDLRRVLASAGAFAPDIVHFHYPAQAFYHRKMPVLIPVALRLRGLRVTQTWHERFSLRRGVSFLLFALGADGYITVRPNYIDSMPGALRPVCRRLPTQFIRSTSAIPNCTLSRADLESLREKLLGTRQRLIAFFGFIYPHKGIEALLEIADAYTDMLLLIGKVIDGAYVDALRAEARKLGWSDDSVKLLGYMEADDVADHLAAADAVVLPFEHGGGDWNTSIHAARMQGTAVVTTSRSPTGLDASQNLFTAPIGDIAAMRNALNMLAGKKGTAVSVSGEWRRVAEDHLDFYQRLTRA